MTISKTRQSTPRTQSNPATPRATLLQEPPAVVVPTAPPTFDPENAPTTSSAAFPRKEELAAVDAAITELGAFSEYTEVLGKTAPPVAQLVAALTVAMKWSAMLASAQAFTFYVHAQTGVTWQAARLLLGRVNARFQVASADDPSLVSQYPALVRLLGAARVAAAKGASTKKANREAKAKGEPAVHGKTGRRVKAAMKLVAALASDSPAPATTPATTSEVAGSTPATTTTATHP
jgi:hypothetical protein